MAENIVSRLTACNFLSTNVWVKCGVFLQNHCFLFKSCKFTYTGNMKFIGKWKSEMLLLIMWTLLWLLDFMEMYNIPKFSISFCYNSIRLPMHGIYIVLLALEFQSQGWVNLLVIVPFRKFYYCICMCMIQIDMIVGTSVRQLVSKH